MLMEGEVRFTVEDESGEEKEIKVLHYTTLIQYLYYYYSEIRTGKLFR